MENPICELMKTLKEAGMIEAESALAIQFGAIKTEIKNVNSRIQDKVIDLMDKNNYEKASSVLKIPKKVDAALAYLDSVFCDKAEVYAKVDEDLGYGTMPVTLDEKVLDKVVNRKTDKKELNKVPLYANQSKSKPHYIEIECMRHEIPGHTWLGLFNFMCDYCYSLNQGHFGEWFGAVARENKGFCQAQESNVPSMMKGWHRICYSNMYTKFTGQPNGVKRYVLWLLKHFGITKDIYVLREENVGWSRRSNNKEETKVKKADKGVKISHVEPSLPLITPNSIVKNDKYGVGTVLSVGGTGKNHYAKVKFGEDIHSFRLKQGGSKDLTIIQTA